MKDFTHNLKKAAFTLFLSFIAITGWSQLAVTSGSGFPGDQQVTLTWGVGSTGGAIDRVVILGDVAAVATVFANTTDPTAASAPWTTVSANFSTAPFLTGSSGPKVLYDGPNTSPQVITNLVNGTPYYFAVYTYKTGSWSSAGAGFSIGPVTPAVPVTTITSSGAIIPVSAGTTGNTIFSFTAVANGTTSLNKLDFVFSIDITPVFNTGTFNLKKDGVSVGAATYTVGTKTLTFNGIAASLDATHTFTLEADVLAPATLSSTISLSNAAVNVTSGTVAAFTTVTNTVNIVPATATLTSIPVGTGPMVASTTLEGGSLLQAIAGFKVTSSGVQNITAINFGITSPAKYTTFYLYSNTTAVGLGTSITSNTTGLFNLTATPQAVGSTPVYFYLVADIAATSISGSSTVTLTDANITLAPTGSNSLNISNAYTFSNSQSSNIVLNGPPGTTPTIGYISNQATSGLTVVNSTSLATFKIQDGGGSSDNDGLPTIITGLTIQLGNFADVRRIAIFDALNTKVGEADVVSATTSFSLLTLTAPDNGSTTFNLRATFKSVVTDGHYIQASVSAATADPANSVLLSAGALTSAITSATTNQIDVVATLLSATPTAPVALLNTNFAVTIKAVDALANVDTGSTGAVTLSTTPAAILTATEGLVNSLVAGSFSWTQLKLSASGSHIVNADYTGLPTLPITVQVLGVNITPANPITLCYGGDFQTLTPITVAENLNTDFGIGTNQSFYLKLPANFIFDTTVTTPPTINASGDISSPSILSYVGNDIVRFSYTISTTTHVDQFMISGLKVKYTGTVNTTGDILVVNSSAIINGNYEADGISHGKLIADAGTPPVGFGFIVKSVPGGAVVNPGDVKFASTVQGVQLVGSPTGPEGVFSGNGVSYNVSNGYIFSPASVGIGSNYIVTFTYTDPSSHCISIAKKTFEVFSSNITNLASDYCENGNPSTGLFVDPTYIHNTYGVTYNWTRFVYYDPYAVTPFTIFGFTYYIFSYNVNTLPGGTTFNPNDPAFKRSYLYESFFHSPSRGIYIGFEISNGVNTFVAESQFVNVKSIPNVSFSLSAPLPLNSFCNNSSPIDLIGSPLQSTINADDYFTASGSAAGAVAPAGGNSWKLTPANLGVIATQKNATISYTHKDLSTGCSNTSTVTMVQVLPVPTAISTAEIPTIDRTLTICLTNGAPTFKATSSDPAIVFNWYDNTGLKHYLPGSFSFTPAIPSQLDNTVTGTTNFNVAQSKDGCEGPMTPVAVVVNPNAVVSIIGANNKTICAGNAITLQGSVGGASGLTWSTSNGTGTLNSPTNGNTTYDASAGELASATGVTILFKLTSDDPDGVGPCAADSKFLTYNLNPIPPAPTIDKAFAPYCIGDQLDSMKANLSITGKIKWYNDNGAGGLGTTTNNVNNGLIPPIANLTIPSVHIYHATQESASGCAGTAFKSVTVVINPLPVLKFKVDSLCYPLSTRLDASSSSIDPGVDPFPAPTSKIVGYHWDFQTDLAYDTIYKIVSHKFPQGASEVTLSARSNKGCSASIKASSLTNINSHLPASSPVQIGPFPSPGFTTQNQCNGETTQFTSFDTSGATGLTYQWDFGDLGQSTASNPTHKYAAIGSYDVKLIMISGYGCADTIVKKTYLLPTVTSFPYTQSFEKVNNGWVPEGLGVVFDPATKLPFNSWVRRIPASTDSINVAADSSYVWMTYQNIAGEKSKYYDNERSVLNGPCIDVTQLVRPALSFQYWDDTDMNADGAYFEVSDDGGATWERLGQIGQGVNWYKTAGIIGLGQQVSNGVGQSVGQQGWSGQTKEWLKAKFALDDYLGISRLRIRFVFGSNGDNLKEELNGFAVDNIAIENRNRLILAENFTNNANIGPASINEDDFEAFQNAQTNLDLVKIQYHTNIGGVDTLNLLNPSDQQARALFYGVTESFKGVLDGYSNGNITPNSNGWAMDYYAKRSLEASPAEIIVSPSTSDPKKFGVDYSIKILKALPAGKYLIQVAIVERLNGQYEFRKFLPDANGTLLTVNGKDQVQTGHEAWAGDRFVDPTQLSAVVFIQNLVPTSDGQYTYREIVQAEHASLTPITVVTGVEPTGLLSATVYPNPADKEFTLELPVELNTSSSIELVDLMGKSFDAGTLQAGVKQIKIATHHLADGMYILQFKDNTKFVRKKIIVVHK